MPSVSKSVSIARSPVMLGFALGLAGGPAGRGWDLRRDAAGNLLLTPNGMGQVSA